MGTRAEVGGPGGAVDRPESTSRAPGCEDTVEIYDSRLFFALYSGGMAMVAIPCALVSGWGPILAAVFGAHALWALGRLVRRRPRISVNAVGIRDENFWYSPGMIRWDEILDVRPTRFGLIEVELRDEGAFWGRLSPLSQLPRVKLTLLGFGPALITPWGLEGTRRGLVNLLKKELEQNLLESVRREQVAAPRGEDEEDYRG